MSQVYPLGTKFWSTGKHKRECTVIDYYVTRNLKNEIVKQTYVASHDFIGQSIIDYDVCAVTIARGLIA